MTKTSVWNLLAAVLLLLGSCNSGGDQQKSKKITGKEPFDAVLGIKYYEVKRRFSTGLSFNELGFQQEPSWIIQFKSRDTVMAYSPQKKRMQPFYLHYDHGDVYNFAKEWFRVKLLSKDSLVFQRLHLTAREISSDIRSDVNLTWYSEDYINRVLKTTAEQLQRPGKADTLYIEKLAEKTNRNPDSRDSAFGARQPVELMPASKLVKVERISNVDKLLGKTEAFDYLFPQYRIDITNAYADFGYEFSVVVDAKGRMYLGTFRVSFPENYEPRKKTLEAIIKVYLQNLLTVIPGKTLGIPHSSEINLTVTGRKNTK
jgi:hypothetical protein